MEVHQPFKSNDFLSPANIQAVEKDSVTANLALTALMSEEVGNGETEISTNLELAPPRGLKLSTTKPTSGQTSSEFLIHRQKRKEPHSCLSLGIGPCGPEKKEEEERRVCVTTKLELYKNPWKITKRLKKSDIDGSSRLLLEKASVETHVIPKFDPVRSREIESNGGTRIIIRDLNTETEHKLTFKRWPSTGSFVLIKNWKKEFVMRRNLRQGDEIGLFSDDQDSSRLYFGVLSRGPVN